MGFPNMVATSYKDFTKEEVKALEDNFTKLIKEYTKEDFVILSCIDISFYQNNQKLIINVSFPVVKDKRNINQDRIVNFSKINFIIRKEEGYLEDSDFHYKKTDRYSSYIQTNGLIIPYKCRRPRQFKLEGDFQYGTQLNDLDYHKALNSLFNNILKF